MNREIKTGRFARRSVKLALWMTVLGLIVFGSYPIFSKWYDANAGKTLSYIAPVADAAETVDAMWGEKLGAQEAAVISQLEQCESGHNSAPLIQYDNNSHGTLKGKDIPSLGILRFKIGTVQTYEKQLYGKVLSEKEAILVALDDTAAEALATDIIFKIDGGLWNWSCATPEMGVRVTLIKEMAK